MLCQQFFRAWGINTRFAVVGVGVCLLTFQTLTGSAQIYTMTDNNSSASVDTSSQAGMYNWTVDGVNQLSQQWFWYALNKNAPASIDTMSPATVATFYTGIGTTLGYNGLTTSYSANSFDLAVTYTLAGGALGSDTADLGEQIRIQNTTASSLTFHFYEYSDFDLNGTPSGDTVNIVSSGGQFYKADQSKGAYNLSETVVSPGANHAQAGYYPATLNQLNSNVPLTLNDNTSAGPGDVTWAFEWDLTIAANSSVLISKDKHLSLTPVPEPSTTALIGMGICALGLSLRRKLV